jgi:hypothetical protein
MIFQHQNPTATVNSAFLAVVTARPDGVSCDNFPDGRHKNCRVWYGGDAAGSAFRLSLLAIAFAKRLDLG